jgi:menaquinone-dependent protoporphyrinogen oxidase
MKILIAYASTHGSTATIAGRIADHLRAHGAAVVGGDVRTLARGASGFDAIIVGARVWGSRYPRRVERFVRENLATLTSRPSAFFSVALWNLSRIPEHRAEARQVPARFLARMGWKPERVEVIAGGLAFSKAWLGFLGELDPNRDYTFTDWDQVESFAESFLRLVAPPRKPYIPSEAWAGI